jgi:hypothetical protein
LDQQMVTGGQGCREDGVDGPQRHQPCHSTGRNNLS